MIRKVETSDAAVICEIYNYYVLNSISTFEEDAISIEGMIERINKVKALGLPWHVYEEEGKVIGYAYATKWKERSAYRFSIETSVYVDRHHAGKGIGSKLYEVIISQLRESGYHSIITGVSQPNESSQKLHEKFGFKKVAVIKEAGFKFNQWVDLTNWQLFL
ncbi:GNAT family N-acetyltransferase [Fusibacter ferrireducens]|uniref:N-acetyltransferase n=1 Tax=Fusibacter ferrireducens TaxID=2785058 RepID=A0ABR9ZMW7_9FIRM|nr:GNAT family N-acetyltransferase [Fusibacter ferrireducens]MBF4691813.1 N-acetyltransferase [Fusibacter ferrireducens]